MGDEAYQVPKIKKVSKEHKGKSGDSVKDFMGGINNDLSIVEAIEADPRHKPLPFFMDFSKQEVRNALWKEYQRLQSLPKELSKDEQADRLIRNLPIGSKIKKIIPGPGESNIVWVLAYKVLRKDIKRGLFLGESKDGSQCWKGAFDFIPPNNKYLSSKERKYIESLIAGDSVDRVVGTK